MNYKKTLIFVVAFIFASAIAVDDHSDHRVQGRERLGNLRADGKNHLLDRGHRERPNRRDDSPERDEMEHSDSPRLHHPPNRRHQMFDEPAHERLRNDPEMDQMEQPLHQRHNDGNHQDGSMMDSPEIRPHRMHPKNQMDHRDQPVHGNNRFGDSQNEPMNEERGAGPHRMHPRDRMGEHSSFEPEFHGMRHHEKKDTLEIRPHKPRHVRPSNEIQRISSDHGSEFDQDEPQQLHAPNLIVVDDFGSDVKRETEDGKNLMIRNGGRRNRERKNRHYEIRRPEMKKVPAFREHPHGKTFPDREIEEFGEEMIGVIKSHMAHGPTRKDICPKIHPKEVECYDALTFSVAGLECDYAEKSIDRCMRGSPFSRNCVDEAISVIRVDGCDTPVTDDYIMSRVRVFCDTDSQTVCADATNG